MADSKKKRLSMLDSLASAGAPAASGGSSMMRTNRALRSARDAVDSHRVWDLDPAQIVDTRLEDRLDPSDVADLRASIESNGQTVPILVRRDPEVADRYLLIYGRRRLEAVRSSESVDKVRAMIANMDDSAAVRAQVVENTGRRDLSFIERALLAKALLDSDYGTQSDVAEVLNVTKSAVSMALSVLRNLGEDLPRAIGPAYGIGRPRWEALVRDLEATHYDRAELVGIAQDLRAHHNDPDSDPSAAAFDAVARRVRKAVPKQTTPSERPAPQVIHADGRKLAKVSRTRTGLKLDFPEENDAFADWIGTQAPELLQDLHARWKATRGQD